MCHQTEQETFDKKEKNEAGVMEDSRRHADRAGPLLTDGYTGQALDVLPTQGTPPSSRAVLEEGMVVKLV